MPIYYCPCISHGHTRLYLPPQVEVLPEQRGQSVVVRENPFSTDAKITLVAPNKGARIPVEVKRWVLAGGNVAAVLALYESIWAMCAGRLVQLNIWSDRGWPRCALESMEFPHTLEPMETVRDLRLTFVSETMTPTAGAAIAFDDYADEYPYAASVGRPGGDPITGDPSPMQTVNLTYGGTFHGVAHDTTEAGDEHRFTLGGIPGSVWRITGLKVVHAESFGSDGTTTVRLATAGVGGGGSSITASVASGEQAGAATSGSFTASAGATLYAFLDAAGDHQNVQYHFRAELVA